MKPHLVGAVARFTRAAVFAALCVAAGVALSAGQASAQDRQLTGRVVDADGSAPIPGVAVTVTGTTLGTTTNDSGHFHLKVPGAAVTLTARRIGFAPRSILWRGIRRM